MPVETPRWRQEARRQESANAVNTENHSSADIQPVGRPSVDGAGGAFRFPRGPPRLQTGGLSSRGRSVEAEVHINLQAAEPYHAVCRT